MAEEESEGFPGIGVAIWFGFLAVLLPLLPMYLGWTATAVRVGSFVLAGIALVIGIIGAAIELRRLGFFEGSAWENIGYAVGIAVAAVVFHYLAVMIPIAWLSVVFKLLVVILGVIALLFLGGALGQFLVEQQEKRAAGKQTSSSRTKAIGASAIVLVTLLTATMNLVTQVVQYLKAAR